MARRASTAAARCRQTACCMTRCSLRSALDSRDHTTLCITQYNVAQHSRGPVADEKERRVDAPGEVLHRQPDALATERLRGSAPHPLIECPPEERWRADCGTARFVRNAARAQLHDDLPEAGVSLPR